MILGDFVSRLGKARQSQLAPKPTPAPSPPMATPFVSAWDTTPEEPGRQSNLPTMMGLLAAIKQAQAPSVTVNGSGSTSAFNSNNEGPGTNGLTFGVQSPYYSDLARTLYGLVEQQFPAVNMGGIFNARNIRGTNTPSEHAYGAALDIMVGNNSLGDAVYQYLMGLAGQYGFSNVLWEVPDHYNHLHVGWLY